MGEPLLAAPLQTLLDKLDQLLNSDRQARFVSNLRTWRSKLLRFRRVLSDAEEKQMSDREVKKWLDKLRDLAYNVDDVLEELRHEALQRQNNSSSDSASSSQLRDLLAQIQEITTTFLQIEEDKNDLGLEGRSEVRSNWPKLHSNETTSLVDSSQIVGREKDVAEILKLLDIGETSKAEEKPNHLSGMGGCPSSSSNNRGKFEQLKADRSETLVIPIVGMGGVGKTTLAQCIYNHNTVKNSFEFQAWVCVSDNFDIIGVTKAILREVASKDAINVDDLNGLQERLEKNISSKRFLIVLDDIWNEDDEKWEKLFIPLKFGRPGSAVIVTTRSSKVALITGSTSNHELDLLEDVECLSILARHALRAQNFDSHPNLKVIGEKMVKRCDGLPLAAKILGGLLRDQDQAKWEEVYGSSLWSGSINEKIAPVLGLSFNYLPSRLKQCFAYCSIFSKDYEFDEEQLILQWMAEGFLGEPNQEQMEDLGHEYFHHLLSRSLLQRSSYNSTKFVMHDLIHDLAQIVAGRVCFRIEKEEAEVVDVEAVRHLSFCVTFGPSKEFKVLKNTKRLRTLLVLRYTYFSNEKLLVNLLPQLRYLRVLSLNSYDINELPSSVGDLKQLRYLNLSNTYIKLLPESLCGLLSLQFLILKGCTSLQRLPLRLKDLANLRYLDISSGNYDLQELPPHVWDLKFFQKLTKFVVGWGTKSGYFLPGHLTISILDEGKDVEDGLVINLFNKKNIEVLKFDWPRNLDNTENAESQVHILNLLEPAKMLRKLEIEDYSGVTLPSWIGDSSYSKLEELSLIDCGRCKSLPSLGQLPLLKKLTIKGMSEIETIGTELYGEDSPHGQPFPSLTELRIENCNRCKSLPSLGQLKILTIRSMPKIETIGTELYGEASPHGQPFPSLTELRIENCNRCKSLPSLGQLKKLTIRSMPKIETIGTELYGEASPHGQLFPSLTELCIENCERCKSLPSLGQLPLLKKLRIWSMPKIETIGTELYGEASPRGQPFPSLTELRIGYCKNLRTLPDGIMSSNSNLQVLNISYCKSLESFESGVLPSTLKTLYIWHCRKLESISEMLLGPTSLKFISFINYPNLTYLYIDGCESIESVPETPNLARLEIRSCKNLKYLPSNLPKLTSLVDLRVSGCDNLVSLPEGGLPSSLRTLEFGECAKVEKQMWNEWAPHKLPCITSLSLTGGFGDAVCFPFPAQDSQSLLPPTLTSLSIHRFRNLESLSSSAFRNVTSLVQLRIYDCPKLRSLPIEALPPSLQSLDINRCPELKSKCEKGGECWGRLSRIRESRIDPGRLRHQLQEKLDEKGLFPRAMIFRDG